MLILNSTLNNFPIPPNASVLFFKIMYENNNAENNLIGLWKDHSMD